jgi:thiol-disulfide isomerase/thioredoxin
MVLVLFGAARKASLVAALVLACLLFTPHVGAASKRAGKAWFGVAMSSAPNGGLVVEHVFPSSPAQRMKLSTGDVLLRVNNVPLRAPTDLVEQVKLFEPGMSMDVVMRRGGDQKSMRVVLEEYPGDEEVQRLMHLGKPAPPVVATAVQGSFPASLGELRGRVVLLDFFASWCQNCKKLSPVLARWQERYKARGLTVVGVTTDGQDSASELVKSWNIPFAVGSDPERRTETIYRVSALPSMYFIDKKGIVRDVRVGWDGAGRESIEKLIERLLAESAESAE